MLDKNTFSLSARKTCLANDIPLNVIPGISKNNSSFMHMLSKKALDIATPYLQEEKLILEQLMENNPKTRDMNFCVIGAGPLFYFSTGIRYANNYIAVEPHINQFVNSSYVETLMLDSKVTVFPQYFEEFCKKAAKKESSAQNTLYVFWFNVINYIESPIRFLNKILKKGDIVFISGWSDSSYAKKNIEKYFECINEFKSEYNLPTLPSLQGINVTDLNYFYENQVFLGKTTEIWIVST